MNYIYDIVLNFNKDYYNFFEWNKKDNITNIKRIPIFVISNKVFNSMKYDMVKVDTSFIELIKDKTLLYSRKDRIIGCLFSNGKEVIGASFNEDGNLIKRSSLLLDEEEEVIDELEDNIYDISIVSIKKKEIIEVNRIQKEKTNYLLRYIKKEKNITNLKYLYYDYFEKEEDNIDIIKDKLTYEITNNFNKKVSNLYDTVLIFNKIKN